jgi:hypothetical protein
MIILEVSFGSLEKNDHFIVTLVDSFLKKLRTMLTILQFCIPVILKADYMSLKCSLVLANNVEILVNLYLNESCVVFSFFICPFK